MKLNQKGWGLPAMIAFCGCLSFCLILAAILYSQNLSIDSSDKNLKNETIIKANIKQKEAIDINKYHNLEDSISKKVEDRMKKEIPYGKVILSLPDIEENLDLKEIKEKYSELKNCNGYAIYDGKEKQAKVYLNCYGVYQSPNYNIDFE